MRLVREGNNYRYWSDLLGYLLYRGQTIVTMFEYVIRLVKLIQVEITWDLYPRIYRNARN